MTWNGSRPAANKRGYGAEHQAARAAAVAELAAAGSGRCAEFICQEATRYITADMDLDLCHDRRNGTVLGLGHRRCNLSEAGVWARSKQEAPKPSRHRW